MTVAGTWSRNFLEPLLSNKNFMNNTLVRTPDTNCESRQTMMRALFRFS